MTEPKHHQSTGFPCPNLYKTSGAKYSGVPHTDIALLSFISILESPKSASRTYPSASRRMFSGLRLIL